jgi:DNA replicative helicase MCM subunit Mcm2 (Cdc46/Mcm family)
MTENNHGHEKVHADIVELLDRIEESKSWCIEHHNADIDTYDTPQLEINLIWVGHDVERVDENQAERIMTIVNVVEDFDEDRSDGVHVSKVIEECDAEGLSTERVQAEREHLKQKGEIYEPRTDHLRVT